MGRFAKKHCLGVVLACDTGFTLHRSPDTLRGPDVAFITRERYASLEDPDKAIPGAPDLAVEVLSRHNRPSETHGNVADYLAAGTAVVWVIDPATEQVAVYRMLKPTLLGADDELTAEELLPGFRVRVGALVEF